MELEQWIQAGQAWLIGFAPKFVAAILVLLVGLFLAGRIASFVVNRLGRFKLDEVVLRFIRKVVSSVLSIVVVIAALNQLGMPVQSLMVVLGAAGLAVALALRGSLENLAAGILIATMGYFRRDDFIEVAGTGGVVQEVGLFTTTLKTADAKKVVLPNASIIHGALTNYSTYEQRRIEILAGVAYGDDLGKVREVLEDILAKDEAVLDEPAPMVAVHSMGDNAVNFVIRPWVNTGDFWPTYWRLQETIKRRFDQAGVSIPFPQRDVHIHQVEKADNE
jgi:small conductance mechanosensitive channel